MPLAATGPKLHGPQVPAKHGAGQCPASGSGGHPRLPGQPSANASPALLPSTLPLPSPPSCLHCSSPTLSFPRRPPHLPCPSPRGLEQRTLGKPRRVGPAQDRLFLGLFPPQSRPATQPRKDQPPPPRGREWASDPDTSPRRWPVAGGIKSNTVATDLSRRLRPGHGAAGDRADPGSSAGPATV